MDYLSIFPQIDKESIGHAVMVTVKGFPEFPNILIFTKEYLQENEINTLCLDAYPEYAKAILKHKYENPCIGHIWLT